MELFSLTLNWNASKGAKVTLNCLISFGLIHCFAGSMTNGRSASNHVSTLSRSEL